MLVSALRTHDTSTDNARANVRAVKTRHLRRPQRMSFSTQVVDGTLACVLGEAALGWTAHRFHWKRTISRNLTEHMIAQFRERTLSSNPLVVNGLAPPNGYMVKCLMLAMLNKGKGSVTISGLHDMVNQVT